MCGAQCLRKGPLFKMSVIMFYVESEKSSKSYVSCISSTERAADEQLRADVVRVADNRTGHKMTHLYCSK